MQTFSLQDFFTLLFLVVIVGAGSAFGPALWRALPRLRDRYFERRPVGDLYRYLTSTDETFADDDPVLYPDESPATTTPQNNNNGIAITQPDSNTLLQAQAAALAAMVKAGKVGETEGIRLVFGVAPSSSNPKYKAARDALKAELDKLSNVYPRRTPEQERLRKELGLTR